MIVRKNYLKSFQDLMRIFMYVEDMEFCYRVKNEGHKVCSIQYYFFILLTEVQAGVLQ